jgi:hypothetical protein
MQQTIRWILVSVVACAISAVITYPIAHHCGYESGYRAGLDCGIGQGCFYKSVALLAALQKVRTGDIPAAIHLMETGCFDSAHTFYKKPTPQYPDAETVKEVAKALSEYRAAYRTNNADWDDMERKLAVELTKIK